jgi:hypothetical protein
MQDALPPQRRQQPAGRGAAGPNLTPAQGAAQAAKRLGLTCFYAGQKVPGFVGCVACQFQIRNRGTLPICPQCGEMVWAWLDEGPPPDPEEMTAEEAAAQRGAQEAAKPQVQDGVKLQATQPVKIEENVKLEP